MSATDSSIPLEDSNTLCDGLSGHYSYPLHLGAIAIVFVASALGVVLPIITKYIPLLRRNPFVFVVAKSASTGVLLCVATVHLLNEGVDAFLQPCVPQGFKDAYPAYALLLAVTAVLMMHALDYELAAIGERWAKRQHEAEALKEMKSNPVAMVEPHGHEGRDDVDCLVDSSGMCPNPAACVSAQDSMGAAADKSCVMATTETEQPPSAGGPTKIASPRGHLSGNAAALSTLPIKRSSSTEEPISDRHHAHGHGAAGHTHGLALPLEDMNQMRRVISAIYMECGVALHSLFVGMVTALTTDAELKPLLVALIFHQLFEGMSMGSRLVDAKFNIVLELIMAAVFSLSAPMGMIGATIGIAVNPTSLSGGGFVIMMGVLDSVCAGILLYLAFTLLFVDFNEEVRLYCADGVPYRRVKKLIMFGGLWFGVIIMSLVGKWL